MVKNNIGMIHGRFQPFHNGHFLYLKKALAASSKVIVGITNPDPQLTLQVTTDNHRHSPEANPFSYFDRMRMILQSILLDPETYSRKDDIFITPFPVNLPDRWKWYIPMKGVMQFMVIIDSWDEEKKTMFNNYGFPVKLLEHTRLLIDGAPLCATLIRQYIQEKKAIDKYVPEGTMQILQEII